MAQNSDTEGFLVGEPVTSLRRSGAGRTDSLLYDIRAEARGIHRALSRPAKLAALASPAVPAGRRKGERAVAKFAVTASPVHPSGRAKGPRAAAQSGTLPSGAAARRALAAATPPVKPGQRDGKGRFVKRDGSSGEGA